MQTQSAIKTRAIIEQSKAILRGDGSSSQMFLYYFVLSALLAFFMQFAIPSEARLLYTIGILPVLVVAISTILLLTTYPKVIHRIKENRREAIITAILSLLFSSFLVFGAWAIGDEVIKRSQFELVLAILVCAYPLFMLLTLFWKGLDTLEGKRQNWTNPSRGWYLALFLILAICWLPYLLAAWPGYTVNDTAVEWEKFTNGTQFDGDVWGHTMYMGWLTNLGINLFGSANAGVAFFTIIQAIIINSIFIFMLGWMRRNGSSRILVYSSFLYLAINPIVAACSMWAVKDVIYSALLILVCISAYNLVGCNRINKDSLIRIIIFILVSVLLCLMRGNGRYVVLISLVFLFFMNKGQLRLMLGCVFAILLIFNALFLSYMSNQKSMNDSTNSKQSISAVFCVPIQQLNYVAYYNHLSEKDMKFLENLGYQKPAKYYEKLADFSFKSVSNMSTKQFVEAYIRIGIKHPGKYLAAFLKVTQDAWNPYSYVDAYNGNNAGYAPHETSFLGFYTTTPGKADSKNPKLASWVANIGVNLVFQKIPGLALLVSIPAYIWLILIALTRTLCVKDKKAFSLIIFLCLASLTALMGPCILGRYFLYLFYGLPLILFSIFNSKSTPNSRRENAG